MPRVPDAGDSSTPRSSAPPDDSSRQETSSQETSSQETSSQETSSQETSSQETSSGETSPQATGAAQPGSRQPRLGVGHLLVWMVGSAVMLAVFRGLEGGWQHQPPAVRVAAHLYHGPVYGAAVCGLLLLWPWRSRRRYLDFPEQPGHWLLVTNGVIALVFCATNGIQWWTPSYNQQLVLHAWATIIPALVYALGAVFARPPTARWTIVLALLFGMHLAQAVGLALLSLGASPAQPRYEILLTELLQATQQWGTPVAGSLLVLAGIFDITRRADRDWLHWAGVTVELATIAWIVFEHAAGF